MDIDSAHDVSAPQPTDRDAQPITNDETSLPIVSEAPSVHASSVHPEDETAPKSLNVSQNPTDTMDSTRADDLSVPNQT